MDEVVGPNIGIGDINAQGEMVGTQFDSGRFRAVLSRDGIVIDLCLDIAATFSDINYHRVRTASD